jgi:hypothetical protein
MEGRIRIETLKSDLNALLKRLEEADNEMEAIEIASSYIFDANITPSMIIEKIEQSLHVNDKMTCTDVMAEVASIIHTGEQNNDDEEEEEEDSYDFVVPDNVKRKFREDEDEEKESICASARKHRRSAYC